MMNTKVRAILLFFLILTFGVLIFGGYLINRAKPPIPEKIVAPSGDTIITGEDIIGGQNYYFSRGGQHIGTIWGHGSYLAPDWSADFLHRMGLYLVARHHGLSSADAGRFSQMDFENLEPEERARLSVAVQGEIKTNRFDPDLAMHFRALYKAVAPGYHMNKRHWNTITLDGSIPDDEIHEMINDSYSLVVRGLKKTDRKNLAIINCGRTDM